MWHSRRVVTTAVPALLLAAVGVGVLAGCTDGDGPTPDPSTAPSPQVHPDAGAIATARERELALLSAYDDAGTTGPGLADVADEARAHHELHLRAIEAVAARLTPALTFSPAAAPSGPSSALPSGPPSTTATATPATGAPTRTDAVALARRLLAAERTAADAGLLAVGDVESAQVRRLLAEVAASEAQHATALYLGLREAFIRRAPATPPGAAG